MVPGSDIPACMLRTAPTEWGSGPVTRPFADGDCSVLPLTEADCGFLITFAGIDDDGTFLLCVQANDQVSAQSWVVSDWSAQTILATGDQPNFCWNFSENTIFSIEHVVEGGEPCTIEVYILNGEMCPEGIVQADVQNCDLETVIHIGETSIDNSYVITFGDGSHAQQSSASEITYNYSQPGTYEICLTYIYSEIQYLTCCVYVDIACICPENFVEVVSVEPCTWAATLSFDLDPAIFPVEVAFGDGKTETVVGPLVVHEYPEPGFYNVCYTEEVPGGTIECCEWINIPGCCLDPSFTITKNIEDTRSCTNWLYTITPSGCSSSPLEVQHLWEFPDGETSTDPFPGDQLFTNFVHLGGEICVTHTITCCDESASATVCIDHEPGAYLGSPGEDLLMDEILPFTGETVYDFITDYASGSVPLLIEGTLIANINTDFSGGIWNMAQEAEIVVLGPQTGTASRLFSISGTTIRSAVHLGLRYAGCCRWIGIRSENRTRMRTVHSQIMDAKYAIHYPSRTVSQSPFPNLYSIGTQYVNNYYAIKSNRQYVTFSKFGGNLMNGAVEEPQHICGCTAVNAIDFLDVGLGTTLTTNIGEPAFGSNEIFNYEKGFNFVNSRLNVQSFNIHHLQDYANSDVPTNNPPGEAAIGIDMLWADSNPSSLNIDNVNFSDFVMSTSTLGVAVRDRIFLGTHTLTAVASNPLSSITTSNIAGGYVLFTGPGAIFNGTVSRNLISTNGGPLFGFGVNGNFLSANNTLEIADNTMEIGSNTSSALNGGVILSSGTNSLGQNFRVLGNTINLYLDQGPGIGITNTRSFIVRRNRIANNSDVIGIQLLNGGTGLVGCNDVRNKPLGLDVTLSTGIRYEANLFRTNSHDVSFTGNVMGSSAFPTRILRNIFRGYDGTSMTYNNAIVGTQLHNRYNRWEPGITGNSIVLLNSPPFLNRYWRPSVATQPSPMFPSTNVGGALFTLPGVIGVDTITTDGFCTSAHDGFEEFSPGPDPKDDWAAIVNDTSYWSGLTAAEQAYMQQEIYGLLLTNPSWTGTSSTLSGFKTSQDASFIGQSELLRQDWQQLMGDISLHQTALEPINTVLDSLSGQAQAWIDAMQADTTLQDSLQLLLEATLQQADSLQALLQSADSLFYPTVENSIGVLLSENTLLDEDSLYAWYEKRYNEIALKWLTGTGPDSIPTADLRQIAQTCLRYGGRAVLSARGLCEVWLNEYYDEGSCNPSLQTRSNDGAAPAKLEQSPMLRIMPNPANNLVRISLQNPAHDALKVQVFTADGRRVYEGILQPNGELEIPVSDWRNGFYIAKVFGGAVTHTHNFVVQHP